MALAQEANVEDTQVAVRHIFLFDALDRAPGRTGHIRTGLGAGAVKMRAGAENSRQRESRKNGRPILIHAFADSSCGTQGKDKPILLPMLDMRFGWQQVRRLTQHALDLRSGREAVELLVQPASPHIIQQTDQIIKGLRLYAIIIHAQIP